MFDLLFILLFVLAILMMLLSLENRDNIFWTTALAYFAMFLFFTLALGALTIESPYQVYNSSAGEIQTGTHIVDLADSGVNFVFLGFGIIMFLYGTIVILGFITDRRDYK